MHTQRWIDSRHRTTGRLARHLRRLGIIQVTASNPAVTQTVPQLRKLVRAGRIAPHVSVHGLVRHEHGGSDGDTYPRGQTECGEEA